MAASCYLLGQKFYPISYKVAAGMAYIIATMILVYLVNSIHIDNQLLALGFHGIIIIAYLAVAYLIEKAGLKEALGSQAN
jgi:hypothetical protein